MGGRHAAVVVWMYLLAVGAIILVVAKVFISDGSIERNLEFSERVGGWVGGWSRKRRWQQKEGGVESREWVG